MRALVLLLVCTAAASAITPRFEAPRPALDADWSLYKQAFKKNYSSGIQETIRRINWEKNLQYIQKHNIEADLGKQTHFLGLNEYADLSYDEFRQMLGFGKRCMAKNDSSTFLPPANIKLPSTVDWRIKGYVTRVKNQGHCGSCWAFSTTGSLEGQHFRKTGNLVSLSEQQLVDCSRRFGNRGCNGGLMRLGFRYIMANGGLDTEASYPYKGVDDVCQFKAGGVGANVTGYIGIPPGNESALQMAVATVGPISVSIDASHLSFMLYSHGVYSEPNCSTIRLNHGVLVVGYGTDAGKDYWLVKNSWGTRWGMEGYIKMSRNKNNQCGIASNGVFPLV